MKDYTVFIVLFFVAVVAIILSQVLLSPKERSFAEKQSIEFVNKIDKSDHLTSTCIESITGSKHKQREWVCTVFGGSKPRTVVCNADLIVSYSNGCHLANPTFVTVDGE